MMTRACAAAMISQPAIMAAPYLAQHLIMGAFITGHVTISLLQVLSFLDIGGWADSPIPARQRLKPATMPLIEAPLFLPAGAAGIAGRGQGQPRSDHCREAENLRHYGLAPGGMLLILRDLP